MIKININKTKDFMIIIPDVHGRTFWKSAVQRVEEGEKIIFLGDYLDPYSDEIDQFTKEYITKKSSIENFKEIIEYKKSHNNVILLIGNHDSEYFLGTPESRVDRDNYVEIEKLFEDNLDLFQVGYILEGKDYCYTFTHSCIVEGWVKKNSNYFGENVTIKEVINKLNSEKDLEKLGNLLGQVGASRWGSYQFGSCVWADCSELTKFDWKNSGVYQIFGHTQQREFPIFSEFSAMLDCRRAFRLVESENKIECLGTPEDKFNYYIGKSELAKPEFILNDIKDYRKSEDPFAFENFCGSCDNYNQLDCPFFGQVRKDTKWREKGCTKFID